MSSDSSWSFGIEIKCALNTCSIADEYYQIVADTDTILHSFCLNNCSIEDFSIQWQIFSGQKFFDNDSIDWSSFQYSDQGNRSLFENLTIKKDWFRTYSYVEFLLIKVFYQSLTEKGYGMSYMKVRQSFFDEICSISPSNGTTKTLFHIECYAEFSADEKRDYTLIVYPSRTSLSTFHTSTLNQLTNNPNELLHSPLKCYKMSEYLHSIASNTTKEQIENLVDQLTRCVSNILTRINGVLLNRSIALDEDISEINKPKDESIQTMNLLNEVLNKHININEEIQIKKSTISFRFSKKKDLFLTNRTDYSSYRTWRTPLPSHGLNDQYLKHSNTLSITVYDQNRNELKYFDEENYLIEFVIPRDVNMKQLPFRNENLLEKNQSIDFNYHQILLIETDSNLTYSFHFEFQPMNSNLSYLLIYKFNVHPKSNSIDDPIYFCSENLTDYHSLFLNNLSTRKDKFVIIGIRELDANETCSANNTVNLQSKIFSANYHYRYYSSACFYRDDNKQWQTDGLIIGSKTNLTHTHCFSHRP